MVRLLGVQGHRRLFLGLLHVRRGSNLPLCWARIPFAVLKGDYQQDVLAAQSDVCKTQVESVLDPH